ncbi:hypothetical protein PPN31114_00216 [Pandoraea pneumonica]|uniref:Uncharacterized protein n=1 Tax=Pandoraea pneumonica TaxID=2508299 RepID=A0A5E4RJ08_9BURK|nr:hypothetical protein [Pandoraea pneumonica]VVD63330.1 hypothetical protein PPN31114_00216 [Pandoraea pneumonica]
MAITMRNTKFIDCGTGISAPADADLDLDQVEFSRVQTALMIRPGEKSEALMELLGKLPPGLQVDDVIALLTQLRDDGVDGKTADAGEVIGKKVSLWAAAKDIAPEVTAYLIKTAIEYFKL